MPLLVVNWIMTCVTSNHFVVLVDGAPYGFFQEWKGIKQGCPLYPLLCFLIIEGMSRFILDAKSTWKIKGIKLNKYLSLTHLLFVDDVLIFGIESLNEWLCFKEIINLFCMASGMSVSIKKLVFSITSWMKLF